MPTILRLTLRNTGHEPAVWDAIAAAVTTWTTAQRVALRDAVVLVPFAQLLPLARRAFAGLGTWMPRIETTHTLAAARGPAASTPAGQISFERTVDLLNAAALLRSRGWGASWERRDVRGFERAADSLVETAHALARAAFALHPDERPAHWERARALFGPTSGPGATERLLARVAVEWASHAPAPASDRLFATDPSAWIAVRAGGADPFVTRLLDGATVPCLLVDTDPEPADAASGDPIAARVPPTAPALAVCDGFEHEAQAAAAQVQAHLAAGETPVALIAQDRLLVRRVRALLEREPVRLVDETGWKLSTTRAAARVVTLLRAARRDATTDALLDWLKTGTGWTDGAGGTALAALEAACRRGAVGRAAALATVELAPSAARLRDAASAVLTAFASPRREPLARWLAALAAALDQCGALQALHDDAAGQQAIAALRLGRSVVAAPHDAWSAAAGQASMDLDGFAAWVEDVLEHATFVPEAGGDDPAQVVVTPLARAMLRPFAAVVLPGADDVRLGGTAPAVSLLSDAQAEALGVPTAAQRRAGEVLAFAHLLTVAPRLTLLRRRVDGADPLADSPLVERLALALAAQQRSFAQWQDPRRERTLARTPIGMTAPAAPDLLPPRLSASGCEALRACPYRFFALRMLGLREDDELEREFDKRGYGNWLHAVLHAFHRDRGAPAEAAVETARLLEQAAATQRERGIADADFVPFAASFASLAPRYIAWLHARDRDGTRWLRGEETASLRCEALEGTELHGIIDRIDAVAGDAIELIDYKTGGVAGLKEKLREPYEDTQLAFYAALTQERTDRPLRAMYLALDGTAKIDEVAHDDVDASARALLDGLAHDLRRLRAGAGMPALGEGSVCDHCAARGICRRDHWSEPVVTP